LSNEFSGESYSQQEWLKATIVHAEAESVAATDRRQIVPLYDRLVRIQPSPVVQLNRAVAIAMRDGPEVGLTHIDAVLEHGDSWGFPNQGFLYSLPYPAFG
jgi:RNA polymerase sigma-70 factor (ECF subfamily)